MPNEQHPAMAVNQRNAHSLAAGIKRTDAEVDELRQSLNSMNKTVTSLQAEVSMLKQEIMMLKVGGYNSGPTA